MKLIIFAAWGPGYGNGHQIRMREFLQLARSRYSCTLFAVNSGHQAFQLAQKNHKEKCSASQEKYFFILDIRDADPLPFLEFGPVLSLDNHSPKRKSWESTDNNLHFYDTLPHPQVSLQTALDQALISPDISDISMDTSPNTSIGISGISGVSPATGEKKKEEAQSLAVFYAGPFCQLPDFFPLFFEMRERKICQEVLWIGAPSRKKLYPFVSFIKQAARPQFLHYLRLSSLVFCYPGMTLLESWFLGKKIVLFSTESKTHNELSSYLEREAGLFYLHSKTNTKNIRERFLQSSASPSFLRPSGKGYALLLTKIQDLLSEV